MGDGPKRYYMFLLRQRGAAGAGLNRRAPPPSRAPRNCIGSAIPETCNGPGFARPIQSSLRAPATLTKEKVPMKTLTTHYIDGAFVESHGREVMDIIRPTNGEV